MSKEVFDIFLDFCYKRTLTNVTLENYDEVKRFGDYYRCEKMVNVLDHLDFEILLLDYWEQKKYFELLY